jgi:hypothetical protein
MIALPLHKSLDHQWWNWLLMDSSCLAVSFCVKIYTCGVVFGYGFNLLCAVVVGVLSCFSFSFFFPLLELQQCSSESGMLDMLPFARLLLWCQFPLFSHQWVSGVPILWCEHRGSPAVAVGSAGSLCTVGGRPPSTSKVVDCHLMEEQGF